MTLFIGKQKNVTITHARTAKSTARFFATGDVEAFGVEKTQ